MEHIFEEAREKNKVTIIGPDGSLSVSSESPLEFMERTLVEQLQTENSNLREKISNLKATVKCQQNQIVTTCKNINAYTHFNGFLFDAVLRALKDHQRGQIINQVYQTQVPMTSEDVELLHKVSDAVDKHIFNRGQIIGKKVKEIDKLKTRINFYVKTVNRLLEAVNYGTAEDYDTVELDQRRLTDEDIQLYERVPPSLTKLITLKSEINEASKVLKEQLSVLDDQNDEIDRLNDLLKQNIYNHREYEQLRKEKVFLSLALPKLTDENLKLKNMNTESTEIIAELKQTCLKLNSELEISENDRERLKTTNAKIDNQRTEINRLNNLVKEYKEKNEYNKAFKNENDTLASKLAEVEEKKSTLQKKQTESVEIIAELQKTCEKLYSELEESKKDFKKSQVDNVSNKRSMVSIARSLMAGMSSLVDKELGTSNAGNLLLDESFNQIEGLKREISEMKECKICNEIFDNDEHQPVKAKCGHVYYCRACLTSIAGENKGKCPICRMPFTKKDIVAINLNFV